MFSNNSISKQKMDADFIRAVKDGNLPVVQELLDNGVDIHTKEDQGLIYAAAEGHLSIIRELLNRGADIHAQSDWPLIVAVANGRLNVVRYLLDNGADVHAQDDYPLIVASIGDNLSIIQELLIHGGNINVLPPNLQIPYQHLVPIVINPEEYYQMESIIEKIQVFPDRHLLLVRDQGYILSK